MKKLILALILFYLIRLDVVEGQQTSIQAKVRSSSSSITGSGSANTVAKFTSGSIVGDSTITDDGTVITLNTTMTIRATVPNGGGFLGITGTLPASPGGSVNGAVLNITSAGSAAQQQRGLNVNLLTGYTGSSFTLGIYVSNTAASTGAGSLVGGAGANYAGYFETNGAGTTNIGAANRGTSPTGVGNLSVGSINFASGSTYNYGLTTLANNSNSGGTNFVALLASLAASASFPALSSAVAVLDNGAIAAPIIYARDASAALPTTGATATWSILDGAFPQYGNGVLTSATMTAERQAHQTTVTSSYTWSNAQVVALGAALTGDITVATLPAKTQVLDVMVVITGQGVNGGTLTVSCGDAIAGTPFINYVVPSDAKAAANTVYGDAVAERGTSIDSEFWYLPSYTATTLVTCHFISTVDFLNATTGSTGRVILTTRLLP